MNNTRRAAIRKASRLVHEARDIIDVAYIQEEESLNNIPQKFKNLSKYDRMNMFVDLLEEATLQLETACDAVDQILNA